METLILAYMGIGTSNNRVLDIVIVSIISGTVLPFLQWIVERAYGWVTKGTYTSIELISTD